MVFSLWKEARLPLMAAIIAAFGSVISEVGASMMVGGNLEGSTRVLTTAIVLETSRGMFASAIALSLLSAWSGILGQSRPDYLTATEKVTDDQTCWKLGT